MSCSFTPIKKLGLAYNVDETELLPDVAGIPFTITSPSSAWLSFEGTLKNTNALPFITIEASIQYYNVATPSDTHISGPVQATIHENKLVTVTPVLLATNLPPGKYTANLLVKLLTAQVSTATVNVTGMFSITHTPTGF